MSARRGTSVLVMNRRRWMALFFAIGSTCFFGGPVPGYAQLVGAAADGVTFFVGSVLFTVCGAVPSWLRWPGKHSRDGGRAAWTGPRVGRDHPVAGPGVLARHPLPGAAPPPPALRLQQARLATGRARVALFRRSGPDGLPRPPATTMARMATGARGRGLVPPRRQ